MLAVRVRGSQDLFVIVLPCTAAGFCHIFPQQMHVYSGTAAAESKHWHYYLSRDELQLVYVRRISEHSSFYDINNALKIHLVRGNKNDHDLNSPHT